MIVNCLRSTSRLTFRVTSPPSPTKQTLPQGRVAHTAASRAAAAPVQSSAMSTPAPPVSSRSASAAPPSPASTADSAPMPSASARRSATVSRAMTRAPIAAASCVALNPTGPWPNTAMVSRPDSSSRPSAP